MASVTRLCIYKRFLERLKFVGKTTTSSAEIGEYAGVPSYLVRKDINYLGGVGVVGRGYEIDDLTAHIIGQLGLSKRSCVIVGIGALGTAVMRFLAGVQQPYDVVAGFDVDKEKIGKAIDGVAIMPVAELPDIVRVRGVELGIIAVPAGYAQETADLMVEAGVKGILNFAPVILDVPEGVAKRDIDFMFELEAIACVVGGQGAGRLGPNEEAAESAGAEGAGGAGGAAEADG